MKKEFIEYIKKEFNFSKEEQEQFEKSIWKPLKKSIRVNTKKISIEDFKTLASKNNWILTETSLWKNTFYIDRIDTTLALWNTLEHISWFFYIQEVSASSSPFYLSNDKIDNWNYIILDMSASPWWKTTQLSEYFPNSIIIANELDKSRLKWLFSNLDRMSSLNTACTNYDWRFFKKTEELFDKVLIDAPCSWEWTSFKTDDALKYWNIKNIKKVAKLQFWLLESAIISTKVWWEIVYSTCTLNKIENEENIEKILEKYSEFVEITPLSKENNFKRNWPHKDITWWFFVAKLKKIKSLPNEKIEKTYVKQNLEKPTTNEEKLIKSFFKQNFSYELKDKYIFKYKSDIFLTNRNINEFWDKLFFYKIWINIWEIKNNEFIPNFYAWTFDKFEKWIIEIDEENLKKLYKWNEIEFEKKDNYYQIISKNIPAWMAKIRENKLKSFIPSKLIIK